MVSPAQKKEYLALDEVGIKSLPPTSRYKALAVISEKLEEINKIYEGSFKEAPPTKNQAADLKAKKEELTKKVAMLKSEIAEYEAYHKLSPAQKFALLTAKVAVLNQAFLRFSSSGYYATPEKLKEKEALNQKVQQVQKEISKLQEYEGQLVDGSAFSDLKKLYRARLFTGSNSFKQRLEKLYRTIDDLAIQLNSGKLEEVSNRSTNAINKQVDILGKIINYFENPEKMAELIGGSIRNNALNIIFEEYIKQGNYQKAKSILMEIEDPNLKASLQRDFSVKLNTEFDRFLLNEDVESAHKLADLMEPDQKIQATYRIFQVIYLKSLVTESDSLINTTIKYFNFIPKSKERNRAMTDFLILLNKKGYVQSATVLETKIPPAIKLNVIERLILAGCFDSAQRLAETLPLESKAKVIQEIAAAQKKSLA